MEEWKNWGWRGEGKGTKVWDDVTRFRGTSNQPIVESYGPTGS